MQLCKQRYIVRIRVDIDFRHRKFAFESCPFFPTEIEQERNRMKSAFVKLLQIKSDVAFALLLSQALENM
jgi:hypothetical protein